MEQIQTHEITVDCYRNVRATEDRSIIEGAHITRTPFARMGSRTLKSISDVATANIPAVKDVPDTKDYQGHMIVEKYQGISQSLIFKIRRRARTESSCTHSMPNYELAILVINPSEHKD